MVIPSINKHCRRCLREWVNCIIPCHMQFSCSLTLPRTEGKHCEFIFSSHFEREFPTLVLSLVKMPIFNFSVSGSSRQSNECNSSRCVHKQFDNFLLWQFTFSVVVVAVRGARTHDTVSRLLAFACKYVSPAQLLPCCRYRAIASRGNTIIINGLEYGVTTAVN